MNGVPPDSVLGKGEEYVLVAAGVRAWTDEEFDYRCEVVRALGVPADDIVAVVESAAGIEDIRQLVRKGCPAEMVRGIVT